MTGQEMVENLLGWKHPVKDANGDGRITLWERILYFFKNLGYDGTVILLPTIEWAAQDYIKTMFPLAVQFVREAANSLMTGDEKYATVRDRLLSVAVEKGISLGKRDIAKLIENALEAVEPSAIPQ